MTYILPDGTSVKILDETLHRNAPCITYTLKGGRVVVAIRKDLWERN